jgi:hypothetical protein
VRRAGAHSSAAEQSARRLLAQPAASAAGQPWRYAASSEGKQGVKGKRMSATCRAAHRARPAALQHAARADPAYAGGEAQARRARRPIRLSSELRRAHMRPQAARLRRGPPHRACAAGCRARGPVQRWEGLESGGKSAIARAAARKRQRPCPCLIPRARNQASSDLPRPQQPVPIATSACLPSRRHEGHADAVDGCAARCVAQRAPQRAQRRARRSARQQLRRARRPPLPPRRCRVRCGSRCEHGGG